MDYNYSLIWKLLSIFEQASELKEQTWESGLLSPKVFRSETYGPDGEAKYQCLDSSSALRDWLDFIMYNIINMKQQKSIFVTVGSTKFDELIQAIDNEEIQGQLKLLGYTKVICQIGNGSYVPTVEHFKFKPSLTDDYKNADLIICHGGAGTILECLRLRKKIIVINNDSLMDNHQMELFNALTNRQLVCGIKSTKLIKEQLLEQVQKLQFLQEYPVPEENKINSIIDSMFVL